MRRVSILPLRLSTGHPMFGARISVQGKERVADKLIDPQQDALFREVNDDLRHEYFVQMWKKYGKYAIATACTLVIFVAGWQIWQGRVISSRLEDALAFEKTLKKLESSPTPALSVQERADLLQDFALRSSTGHGTLARLHAAAELAQNDHTKEAIALWHVLRDDLDVDPVVRDIARFLAVQNALDLPRVQLEDLEKDLEPLTGPSGNLKYLALELKGLIALQGNHAARAATIFDAMVADQTTPPHIRERVQSIRSSLAFAGPSLEEDVLNTSQKANEP